MRQAIQTKYHGPSNVKGSRYSARCDAGSVMLSADHSLGFPENHMRAAKALAIKLGWNGLWCGGSVPSLPSGYVFVLTDEVDFTT